MKTNPSVSRWSQALLVFSLVALLPLPLASLAAEKKAASAPKAKPMVIDASTYPNLQAAFDAVPATGGLVRLPPGEFELDQPLLLTSGDTRIEGAGTATHLINRSTKGEPALIIRPRSLSDLARRRRL